MLTAPWWNLHQGDYDWGNTFPQAGVPDKPWALARPPPLVPVGTLLHGEKGTKRVLECARLATGFANVRASRYGIH